MCKVIYHPHYSKYNPGKGHPFDPVRIEMVIDLLKELGLLKNVFQPQPVQPEELYTIHSEEYVQAVESLSSGENKYDTEIIGLGSLDNPVFPGMGEAARYQVGGSVLGAKLLLQNEAKLVLQMGGGFHHAHPSMASGFCIYNDLAFAIKQMTDAGWHIVYLDLDVHHCDGVQKIFYSDDKVMTISFHESGEYLFPGTGWINELGKGMGRSLKLNIPLEPFTEGESYFEVMNKILEPALSWFKPDGMVIQAGADAHFSDPLADLLLTTQDFERNFRKVLELINSKCNGRALFTLGGGYSIQAAFRIWTILYLILCNYDIPKKLPEDWRKKWRNKTGFEIPAYFHDPLPAFEPIKRKNDIARHNLDTVHRLLDLTSVDWI